MSLNFSAEQFESCYKPERLGQWETTDKVSKYPERRIGPTLPAGVKKAGEPSFVGTWGLDFPKPKSVPCDAYLRPGMWLIRGGRARWVEAFLMQPSTPSENSAR